MATQKTRAASLREIARLVGCSLTHIHYIRKGERKSRVVRTKMRELGLRFKPVK